MQINFWSNAIHARLELMLMTVSDLSGRLKACGLLALAMVLLSLIPQIELWILRGREWNGAYVSVQGDELLYSGYINALINGRPRKNDPFGGRDSTPTTPLPESTFSIQIIPSYVIAFLSRLFGASASTAFIVLVGVAALLASFSIFWLLKTVTANYQLAAVGTLFVLCFGCLVGRYGVFNRFFDIGIPALHFLRRYQPAAAFFSFFVFQALTWRALHSQKSSVTILNAALAGLTFAVLVFSYLYLWTGAAAWLVCIAVLWFCLRPCERQRIVCVLTIVGMLGIIALIPYLYLVSHRAPTLDVQQTLISTHRPDLLRMHEILGGAILVILVMGVLRRRVERSDPRVIYASSLALLPFIVFNQQVLTGKTMQAFHYEIFVVNYSTLVGLVIVTSIFWTPVSRRLLMWGAILSILWGVLVVGLPARLTFVPLAVANDKRVPVLLHLGELSRQDGTLADLHSKGETSSLVFSPELALSVLLPTWTSQGTLLDVGAVDFGSVTAEERKRFLYIHLYYTKMESEAFRKALNGMRDDPAAEGYARSLIFGHERITPALSFSFKAIQPDEIEREVQMYKTYVDSFSREEVLKRPITYAIVRIDSGFDFSHVDRWYERNAGEPFGEYMLYRLKVRPD